MWYKRAQESVRMQEPVTAENAGKRLQTRCERETLSRFPRTGAILFTIRTHMRKLQEFEGRPDKVRPGNYLLEASVVCSRSYHTALHMCLAVLTTGKATLTLWWRINPPRCLLAGNGACTRTTQPAARAEKLQDHSSFPGSGAGVSGPHLITEGGKNARACTALKKAPPDHRR